MYCCTGLVLSFDSKPQMGLIVSNWTIAEICKSSNILLLLWWKLSYPWWLRRWRFPTHSCLCSCWGRFYTWCREQEWSLRRPGGPAEGCGSRAWRTQSWPETLSRWSSAQIAPNLSGTGRETATGVSGWTGLASLQILLSAVRSFSFPLTCWKVASIRFDGIMFL